MIAIAVGQTKERSASFDQIVDSRQTKGLGTGYIEWQMTPAIAGHLNL